MEPATFERAADLNARKSTALYWLERLAWFGTFVFLVWIVLGPLQAWVPIVEKYELIPICLLAGAWAWFDDEIRYRYGRRKRTRELIEEFEAGDVARAQAEAGQS